MISAVDKYIFETNWDTHCYQHTKTISHGGEDKPKTVPAKVAKIRDVIKNSDKKDMTFDEKRELIHKITMAGEHQFRLFSSKDLRDKYRKLSHLTETPAINIKYGYFYNQLEEELDQTFGEMLGKENYTHKYAAR